jgi:hypothetical protein
MDPQLGGSGALEVALVTRERLDLLVHGVHVRQQVPPLSEIPVALKKRK